MAKTFEQYTGDGVRTVYPVDFILGYLEQDDIYVYQGDDYNTQLSYTWQNSTTIELDAPVVDGTTFRIRRIVDRSELINSYSNGARLGKNSLNQSFLQTLMLVEEIDDGFISADGTIIQGDLSLGGNKLIDVAEGTELTDGVNLEQVLGLLTGAGVDGVVPTVQPRQIGDGVTTTFSTPTIGVVDVSPNSFFVSLDGVTQRPTLDFIITAGGYLQFVQDGTPDAPAVNTKIDITYFNPVSLGDLSTAAVTATGTTTPRPLGDRFADVVNIKDFGAVSGEVSTAAINLAALHAETLGAQLSIPAGDFLVDGQITLGKGQVIEGKGSAVSSLRFVGEAAKLSWVGNPNNYETLSISKLSIFVDAVSTGNLIEVTPSTILGVPNRGFTCSDLSIIAVNSGEFDYAIKLNNVRNSVITNTNINASGGTSLGAIHLNEQCLDATVSDLTVTSVTTGLLADGNTEGILLSGVTMVGVINGVVNTPTGTGEPWISIKDSHINFRDYGVRLGQVLKSSLNGNLLFATSTTAGTPNTCVEIDGTNAQELDLGDNIYSGSIATDPVKGVHVKNGHQVCVHNEIFRDVDDHVILDAPTYECTVALNKSNGAVTNKIVDNGTNNVYLQETTQGFKMGGSGDAIFDIVGGSSSSLRFTDLSAPSGDFVDLQINDGVTKLLRRNSGGVIQDTPIRISGRTVSLGGDLGNESLRVSGAASYVNRIDVVGGSAGGSPAVSVEGSDTDIDLRLNTKGGGLVRFGSYISSIDAASTGYINMKDSSGVVRRVMVRD